MKPAYLSKFEDSMNEFLKDFSNFIAVFTVKRVTVMLIVAFIVVLLCAPKHDSADEQIDCGENSCPYPQANQ